MPLQILFSAPSLISPFFPDDVSAKPRIMTFPTSASDSADLSDWPYVTGTGFIALQMVVHMVFVGVTDHH